MTTKALSNMDNVENAANSIKEEIGDALNHLTLSGYQVLVGIYKRPDKTKSGIYLTDATRKEDEYQGKVGLVLKMGPKAFEESEKTDFGGVIPKIDDWVFYRVMDGFDITLNGFRCRILDDTKIRGIVTRPDVLM